MRRELYFSTDVETDGRIPGPFSMVSIGIVVAGYVDTFGQIVRLDPDAPENRFYAELKPISEQWDPEALAVSGLTREHLLEHGEDPREAMTRLVAWINQTSARYMATSTVFAAYPLGFDWLFTYWYIVNFAEQESPFGHSKHIDMKTYYAAKANQRIAQSVKGRMPKQLLSKRAHTHHALDDAAEQGELLMNLLEWDGNR
jgi:hypothetical protein